MEVIARQIITYVSLSDKIRAREVSGVLSEQLTPKLSQGVLIARHADRLWQVACVHVAQPELPLNFTFAEKLSERKQKGAEGELEGWIIPNSTTRIRVSQHEWLAFIVTALSQC